MFYRNKSILQKSKVPQKEVGSLTEEEEEELVAL
jgi:hypothetical protein